MNRIADQLASATAQLAGAGVPNPAVDAEWLLAFVLHASRSELLLRRAEPLTPQHTATFAPLLQRRMQREPLQYILGTQAFYGREFRVTPAVLIPRPETEQLAELVLRHLPPDTDAHLLDVGTGSGCIAVTLLCERPHVRVTATDVSPAALAMAAENAAQHGVMNRLTIVSTPSCWPDTKQRFAGIISNPPYGTDAEWPTLQPEVREWEPRQAVVAGPDGLAVTRPLLAHAPDWLAPGGFLCIEVGHQQARTVAALAQTQHAVASTVHRDLQGIERFVWINF